MFKQLEKLTKSKSQFFVFRRTILHVLFASFLCTFAMANPFLIDFPEKEELTNEDYLEIQEKLHKLPLEPLVQEYYEQSSQELVSYNWFRSRICMSNRLMLIDPEKGLYPKTELVKINQGGERCFVVFATYNRIYPQMIAMQIEQLKAVGFNGYYLYFLGALPNPTGKEIKYAGIPYGFKIFAMMEAQKKGFNSVIWLDSALCPLNDPAPLFEELENTGAVFSLHPVESNLLLPVARNSIYQLTGVDLHKVGRPHAGVFGLYMEHPLAKEFINTYYIFAENGYPFFAVIPEEFAWAGILGQRQFASWFVQKPVHSFITYPTKANQRQARKRGKTRGFFFYQESH